MTKDEALKLALEALERASHSLGSFVSDHGWGQEDMDTFDSVIAAEHRIKEALAQPEQKLKQVAHVYLLDAKGWPKVGWDDGRGIKVGDKLYTLTSAEELLTELISAPENVSIPQPEERYFCPRCGKRTADLTTIHTCTPPVSQVADSVTGPKLLTDDAIEEIARKILSQGYKHRDMERRFARAIEQAYGIGGTP